MTETSQQFDPPEEDTIKILVASDIHLGYNEKDIIRGEDSFIAFEEVLQHAMVNEVDAILLGGDLFHIANPSTNTLNRCFRLLKTYTFGDKPIKLEFLSDQNENFPASLNRTVNYEDPNINVAIPVFSIHGNHDDPSGFGRISSMDLLNTNGYVNYFGKWTDLTKINISPVMLQKGETKLAMYGLSHIGDARLCRLFEEAKVFLEKPEGDGWFNVMVLHQNRADRGPKNYLPEKALPGFLDLVIWGHEHDCRIVPEENPVKKFFVSQPGSTVATSLADGESLDKCCGLLKIYKGQFRLDPIRLKSVRPFVFESINLIDYRDELALDEGDVQQKTLNFATEKIEELIERAKEKWTDNERQPKLPLVRLRLELTEVEQKFNAIRFGQRYNGRVANPLDMVTFKKRIIRTKDEEKPLDKELLNEAYQNQREQTANRAEEVVDKYFQQADESKQLQVVCPRSMTELCRRMVDYKDDDAAEKIVKFYERKALEYLNGQVHVTEDIVDEVLLGFHASETDLYDQMLKMLDSRTSKRADPMERFRSMQDESNEDGDDGGGSSVLGSTRGARGGARGGRTSKAAASVTVPKATTTRGGRRAAATKGQTSIASVFGSQQQTQSSNSLSPVVSRSSARNRSKIAYIADSDED